MQTPACMQVAAFIVDLLACRHMRTPMCLHACKRALLHVYDDSPNRNCLYTPRLHLPVLLWSVRTLEHRIIIIDDYICTDAGVPTKTALVPAALVFYLPSLKSSQRKCTLTLLVLTGHARTASKNITALAAA